MAGNTLATLLIKLGFDVSGIAAGGNVARSELESIGAAARKAGDMILPTTAALNNLAKAADSVKGSTGGTTSLNNLAKAAQAVSTAVGSAPGAMNAFARAAAAIGSSTGSGTALNAFAKAAAAVTAATGSPQVLTRFAQAATLVAQSGNPAGLIGFAKAMTALAPAAAEGGVGLAALEASTLAVTSALSNINSASGAAAGGISAAVGSAGAAAGQLNALGGAAAGAVGGVSALGAAEVVTAGDAADLVDSLQGTASAAKGIGDSVDNLARDLATVGPAEASAASEAANLATNLNGIDAAASVADQASATFTGTLGSVAQGLTDAGNALNDFILTMNDANPRSELFAEVLGQVEYAVRQAKDYLADLTSQTAKFKSEADSVPESTYAFRGGLDDVRDSAAGLDDMLIEMITHLREAKHFMEGGGGGLEPPSAPQLPPGPPPITPPPTFTGGMELDAAIDEINRMLEDSQGLQDGLKRLDDQGDQTTESLNNVGEAAGQAGQSAEETAAGFEGIAERLRGLSQIAQDLGGMGDNMFVNMHWEMMATMLDQIAEAARRGEPALGDLTGKVEMLSAGLTQAEAAAAKGGPLDLGTLPASVDNEVAHLIRLVEWADEFSGAELEAGLASERLGQQLDNLAGPAKSSSEATKALFEQLFTLQNGFKEGEIDLQDFVDGVARLGAEADQLAALPSAFDGISEAAAQTSDNLNNVVDRARQIGEQALLIINETGSQMQELMAGGTDREAENLADMLNRMREAAQAYATGNIAKIPLDNLEEAANLVNDMADHEVNASEAARMLQDALSGAWHDTNVDMSTSSDLMNTMIAQINNISEAEANVGETAKSSVMDIREMTDALGKVMLDPSAMAGFGNYIDKLKASLLEYKTTGTGPMPEEEMSRQISLLEEFTDRSITASVALGELQTAGTRAAKAAEAMTKLGEGIEYAGSREAFITSLIARVDKLSGTTYEAATELDRFKASLRVADDKGLVAYMDGLKHLELNAKGGSVSMRALQDAMDRVNQSSYELNKALSTQATAKPPVMPVEDLGAQADEVIRLGDMVDVTRQQALDMGEAIADSLGPENEQYAADLIETINGLTGSSKKAQAALDQIRATIQQLGAIRGPGAVGASADLEQIEELMKHTTLWEKDLEDTVSMTELRRIAAYTADIQAEMAQASTGIEAFGQAMSDVPVSSFSEHITNLLDRLTKLQSDSYAANQVIGHLADTLSTIRGVAETGGLDRTDITDVKGAEAALVSLEEAARRWQGITEADADAAREAFQRVRDGVEETVASVDQLSESATNLVGGFKGLDPILDALSQMQEAGRLTAEQVNAVAEALVAMHPAGPMEAALADIAKTSADTAEEVRRLTADQVAFGEASDTAGEKAEVYSQHLTEMYDAGKMTIEQLNRLQQALEPWVNVSMGEGFAVPQFSTTELDPLLKINEIMEEIVKSGKVAEDQIAAVEAQAARSTQLSVANEAAAGRSPNGEILRPELTQAADDLAAAADNAANKMDLLDKAEAELGMTIDEAHSALQAGSYYEGDDSLKALVAGLQEMVDKGQMASSTLERIQQVIDNVKPGGLSAVKGELKEILWTAGNGLSTTFEQRFDNVQKDALSMVAEQQAAVQRLQATASDPTVVNALSNMSERLAAAGKSIQAALPGEIPFNAYTGLYKTGDAINYLTEKAKTGAISLADLKTYLQKITIPSNVAGIDMGTSVDSAENAANAIRTALREAGLGVVDLSQDLNTLRPSLESMASEAATLGTRLSDLTYAESIFDSLTAKVENFVGASREAQSYLDKLRDDLIELGNQAGMGRTMDPNVIKAYTAAVDVLSASQKAGMVSANAAKAAQVTYDGVLNAGVTSLKDFANAEDLLDAAGAGSVAQVDALRARLEKLTATNTEAAARLDQLRDVLAELGNALSEGAVMSEPVLALEAFNNAITALEANARDGVVSIHAMDEAQQAYINTVASGHLAESFERSQDALNDLGGVTEEATARAKALRDAFNDLVNTPGLLSSAMSSMNQEFLQTDLNAWSSGKLEPGTMPLDLLEKQVVILQNLKEKLVSTEQAAAMLDDVYAEWGTRLGMNEGQADRMNDQMSLLVQHAQNLSSAISEVMDSFGGEGNFIDGFIGDSPEITQRLSTQIELLRGSLQDVMDLKPGGGLFDMPTMEAAVNILKQLGDGSISATEAVRQLSIALGNTGYVALPSFEQSARAVEDSKNQEQLAQAADQAASTLNVEAAAADASAKALHGAALAAHEAKVARDAANAAAGAGGAGGTPPPSAPPTGPTPPDDGEMRRRMQELANLLAQLQSVRAAAAAAGAAGAAAAPGLAATAAAGNAAGAGGAAAAAGGAGAAAGLNAAGAAAGNAAPQVNNAANAGAAVAANFGHVPAQANAAAAGMNKVASAAGNAADRSSFLNRTLSMAFAFSGGVAVTNVISFMTDALVGFNSRLEQTQIAFTSLLGSEGLSDAFIAKMERFANVTPFTFTGLKDSVQRLMAMGFAAEDTLTVLTAVGDAVAATGGNAEKLNRITVALGQMYTAGKVNAQDMRQLTEAMVPAWRFLAEAMGTSVAEAQKAVTNGLVPASQGITAILRGMEAAQSEGGFGGMMAKQARTAQGALSTIADNLTQTVSKAVNPFFEAISKGMVVLGDFFVQGGGKYLIPTIYAIGAAIGMIMIPKIYGMIASLATAKAAIAGVMIPMAPLIVAITTLGIAWQENIGGIRDSLGPVLQQLANVAGELVKPFIVLMGSTEALTKMVAALAVGITAKLVASLIIAGVSAIKAALGFGVQSIAQAAATTTSVNLAAAQTAVADAAARLTIIQGNATRSAVVLAAAESALAKATADLALAEGAAATAAAGAATSTGILGTIIAALGGPVTAIVALVAVAATLILTFFDQIVQGIRNLYYNLFGYLEKIADLMSGMPGIGDWAKGVKQHIAEVRAGLLADMARVEAEIAAKKAAEGAGTTSGANPADEFIKDIEKKIADLEASMKSDLGVGMDAASKSLLERFGTSMNGVLQAAKEAGGKLMLEYASGIQSQMDAPFNALKELHTSLKSAMSPLGQVAFLYAQLASKDLAEGLGSGNSATKAKSIAIKKLILEQLDQLPPNAALAGLYASGALANGLVDPKAIAAIKKALSMIQRLVGGFFDRMSGGMFAAAANLLQGQLDSIQSFTDATDWLNQSLAALDTTVDKTNKALQDMAADAKYELGEAWKTIEDTAKRYFDSIHEKMLKQIQGIHDVRDEQLKAAEDAARRPGKEMQSTYNAMKDARKLAELQKAVADAQASGNQKDLFAAQQNLSDFQTEQEITRLTDIGEVQVTALELQRKANDDLLKQQQDAENLRYKDQQDAFTKELTALQSFLDRHPEAWAATHAKVLKLLNKYGITYNNVGLELGNKFAKGLLDAEGEVRKAARIIADAAAAELAASNAKNQPKLPPKPKEPTISPLVATPGGDQDLKDASAGIATVLKGVGGIFGYLNSKELPTQITDFLNNLLLTYKPPTSLVAVPDKPQPSLVAVPDKTPQPPAVPNTSRIVPFDTGAWNIPNDMLGLLHSAEMVVPAGPAALLRELLAGRHGGGDWQTEATGAGAGLAPSKAAQSLGGNGGNGGGGTIVVQLDGETITRIVDRRLAVREDLVNVHTSGSQW